MRTMKKGLSWLLTLSMILSLFTGLTVSAGAAFDPANTTPEPTAESAFEFKNGSIKSYTGDDTNVVIPAQIEGTDVKYIAANAFDGWYTGKKAIVSFVIPSTVENIGDSAFDTLPSLTDIFFYGDAPEFGEDLLLGCTVESVTFHCKSTYKDAFDDAVTIINNNYYCDTTVTVSNDIADNLSDPVYNTNEVTITATTGDHGSIQPGTKTVTKGENVTFTFTPEDGFKVKTVLVDDEPVEVTGDSYTFENVQDNHTIHVTFVPNDPIIAAQEGFSFVLRDDGAWIRGYTGNGGDITLPTKYVEDGTTYDVVGVAANAFNTTNSSVTGVKDGEAIAKITKITVPEGIKTIETGAFSGMGNVANGKNVEEIVFLDPDTKFVHSGTAQAFHLSSNPKLKSVTLPANLTAITSSMFYDCSSLTELVIPAGVTAIGERAFEGCTALKKLTFTSTVPAELEKYTSGMTTTYPFEGCTNLTIHVPAANLEAYQTAWAVIADTVTFVGVDESGEPVIGAIPDFKVYDQGSDEDYIEYHVTKFDNKAHTGEVEVKYVGKNGGTLTIPETVTTTVSKVDFTLTVVGIGEKAMDFLGYEPSEYSSSSYNFAEIELPSTLEYIGKWGLAGLVSVKTIDMSGTQITSIGDMAFNNCSSVETISLPDTLANIGGKGKETARPSDDTMNGNNVTGIKDKNNNDAATSGELNTPVEGPDAAPTQMAENVFRGCGKLKQFIVSDNNQYFKAIGGVLFSADGKTLIRYPMGKDAATYDIPEGTEIIAEAAFMLPAGNNAASALTSVTFPNTLKEIKDGAFRQSSLTNVELPANVEFGRYIFDCSKHLAEVTTAEGLTAIPEKAFWGCENLTSVTLGESVKTIGESAFERCAFTSIDLSKVTEIGDYAFYFSALTDVTVPAATKTGKGAFMNCPELTSAIVEGTTLDPYMFFYCTALETLTAENVTKIEPFALGYCVKLTTLPISKIESIGYGAFRNCRALTTVTLPATLKELGKYAFADCDHLTTVTFANDMGVKILPEGTFYECLGLTDVYLGNSISMTEGMAFYCAGWNNGLKVNVHSDLSENLFFRNEFEACFIDLGSQQTANEIADEISYIWTKTETVNGVKTYYFRAKASGGCGGGCGGGGTESADGMADFTMSPSVTVNYHWGENSSTENLPKLLTIYEQNGENAAAKKVDSFNMVDLKDKAAAHAEPATQSLARGIALFSSEAPTVTTGTVGYQYMGMRGWSIMAATEYVTLDDLGITLKPGDTLKVSASDKASYTVSYKNLMENNRFFPASTSNGTKKFDDALTVPAILALTWNTATIDGSNKTDGEVLSDVAKTAYRSTNFRFAHGLSWGAYNGLAECEGMQPAEGEVCSGYRLLQKVDSITVIHADGSTSGGSVGGGSTSGKTETVTNADGSTTKTETKSDGTVVETTTKPDGSTTVAETKPDGSVSTVEKRADGTEIKTAQPASGAVTASVSVPKSVGSTRVDIPVSKPSGSMVAVIVHPDGTEEIVKDSVVTETGIALRAEGDVQLKIIDNAKRFSDMADHWAKDAVEFASSRELFNGVGNDAFGPDLSMTRGMVNTVLARLAGADTAGGETWYAKGTAWAVENGISDGTNPEQQVTREQLAAMLYRYAGSPAVSGELSFDDTAVISVWAYDAVRWCVDNGILNGMGGNRMAPQDLAQRGQVAAMLMRFLQATV